MPEKIRVKIQTVSMISTISDINIGLKDWTDMRFSRFEKLLMIKSVSESVTLIKSICRCASTLIHTRTRCGPHPDGYEYDKN